MAYFSFLMLVSTSLAESASSTTPVLKLFPARALRLPQAKEMEGFTAHLAEDKLKQEGRRGRNCQIVMKTFKGKYFDHDYHFFYLDISAACTQETEHPGRDRHRCEQAEATRLPHLLYIMVPLEIHSNTMHSVAGRSGLGLAPSRGSAQPV